MTKSPKSGRAETKRSAGKKPTPRRNPHRFQGGSREANRLAVAILEVLAGARSPAEAAEALEISLPRYYILETRALEGMVAVCEPKPLGKQASPETRIAALEKELQQAHRECARQQALVRVAQRSVGLSATETQKGKTSPPRDRRGRRKRRPAVRALKAADTLKNRIASAEISEVQQTVTSQQAAAPGKLDTTEDPGTVAGAAREHAPLAPQNTLERVQGDGRTQAHGPPAGPSSGRIPTSQATPGDHSGDGGRKLADSRGL